MQESDAACIVRARTRQNWIFEETRQELNPVTCKLVRKAKIINTLQVRPAGQAGYPISLVASLDTVPVKCCVPLHY